MNRRYFSVDDQLSIFEQQNQLVVKSNDLIRKTRFTLSAQEQKVILFLISKIKPDDEDFQEYEFDIIEFCKVCNISCRSGANFEHLKSAIKSLRDKSFWIKIGQKETICSWVQKATIEEGKSIISIRLDEDLKPYLLKLKKWTQYELAMTLSMRGKYSIRLYEIFKSYAFEGSFEIEVAELKELLNTAEYKSYKDFRVNVLDKAVGEVNQLTDLNVTYSPNRTGRSITSLSFQIQKKEGF